LPAAAFTKRQPPKRQPQSGEINNPLSGGSIRVRSTTEGQRRGTTFSVVLPAGGQQLPIPKSVDCLESALIVESAA
jgi:hypothetical protein